MKRILITGISGKLGSILADGLGAEYDIFGLDARGAGGPQFARADISDFEALKRAFEKLPPLDAVVHFAADPYPFANWDFVLTSNIAGTRNLYECCRLHGVDRVIFASSTHAVGKYEGYPFNIEGGRTLSPLEPPRPDEFYGLSKAIGELIARTYHDLFAICSVCLRIGHVSHGEVPDPDLEKLELLPADLIQLVRAGIETNIGYGIYFAVSDIEGGFLDLTNAKDDLGYEPGKVTS